MKLYNTYSQKKEKINLTNPIGIYVCGVTPYDTTHLGHAFTFIIYDALIRYLRFLGAKVTYVQNVTDIDDDILIKAKSLKTSWKSLGQSETKKHQLNMDSLNALRPDFYPHATDNVDRMIEIIKVLVKKNLAYVEKGSVYFSVKSDKNFGKLSKFGYSAMLQIANDRGNYPLDPNKKDPLDFVLWQDQKPGEPFWNSTWGKGRPGWHIECSTMSMKYLGPTVTIHGGGEDLIFPHHECEIAQSENFTNKKFVKFWMHTAMVYCQEKKMSKSLGNMIFVHDLLKKYSANTIRILLLSHHYRHPWNYNEKDFSKAQEISKMLESKVTKTAKLTNQQIKKKSEAFFDALNDDFNTSDAIDVLYKIAKKPSNETGEIVYKCAQILGLEF